MLKVQAVPTRVETQEARGICIALFQGYPKKYIEIMIKLSCKSFA